LRIVYELPKILNQLASHQGFSLPKNPIKAGKSTDSRCDREALYYFNKGKGVKSTILVHQPEKKGYNFLNFIR
jgi:hypothetical protein